MFHAAILTAKTALTHCSP